MKMSSERTLKSKKKNLIYQNSEIIVTTFQSINEKNKFELFTIFGTQIFTVLYSFNIINERTVLT